MGTREEGTSNVTEKDFNLLEAAKNGDIRCLKSMLETRTDVNEVDNCGYTGLVQATKYNHIKCAEALIQAGADVNSADIFGDTALIHAAETGHD